MKRSTQIIVSSLFYMFVAVGASLIVKANVGMDCFYAFVKSVSTITSIKVGTLVATVNAVFVVFYIILSKGKNIKVYIIQAVSIIIFGSIVNFLLYNVFNHFDLTYYAEKVIVLVSGVVISGISIGVITVLHIITFSIEATCYQLEKLHKLSFIKARYGIDLLFLITSLLISFIFKTDFFIREGTVISIVLYSFVLNLSKSFTQKHFNINIPLHKIDEES